MRNILVIVIVLLPVIRGLPLPFAKKIPLDPVTDATKLVGEVISIVGEGAHAAGQISGSVIHTAGSTASGTTHSAGGLFGGVTHGGSLLAGFLPEDLLDDDD